MQSLHIIRAVPCKPLRSRWSAISIAENERLLRHVGVLLTAFSATIAMLMSQSQAESTSTADWATISVNGKMLSGKPWTKK